MAGLLKSAQDFAGFVKTDGGGYAKDDFSQGFEKFQKPLTKAFHDKGGKLMAGTDSILPGIVPGFSLHRELKELVGIGLTPFEALLTATTRPFEYLGESDKAGTIELGKRSGLVLLDANPLEDISGASKVSGVLVRGRWLGSDEIKKRMKSWN